MLHCFEERGFLHGVTDGEALDVLLSSGSPVTAYIGFDATAPSLHVGSLLPIMMLRWWQHYGHRPLVLMGGGTTLVGDPSGRDATRRLLTSETIAAHGEGIREIFKKFLVFGEGATDGLILDNAEWLSSLNYLDFMRDVGRYFSMNRMLTFDSVRLRLEREQHLSLLEFNYMVLQAYDFLVLSQREQCCVQMGGSDQWGNIVNGIELTRRMEGRELYGLTAPLLTTSSGHKMGKTAEGAVWLREEDLSSYEYWQFWRNTMDGDVGRFLRMFTELPLDEIGRLEVLEGEEINEAKVILAREATGLCHGADAARRAEESARVTFEEGGAGKDLPRMEVARGVLGEGLEILVCLEGLGFAGSKSEGRRLIKQGGVRVNGKLLTCHDYRLGERDFEGGVVRIGVGKKRRGLIELL